MPYILERSRRADSTPKLTCNAATYVFEMFAFSQYHPLGRTATSGTIGTGQQNSSIYKQVSKKDPWDKAVK